MIQNSPRINTSQIDQMTIFDFLKYSEDELTTERVCKLLQVSAQELRQNCKTGKFWELDSCVVLHKGRNCWRILKTRW